MKGVRCGSKEFYASEWSQRQQGTAMIEFLIVAPLLLLLVFGVAELGRLVQHNEILNKGVRNAARYAAEQSAGSFGVIILTDALKTRIRNLVVYGLEDGGGDPILPGLDEDLLNKPEEVIDIVSDPPHIRVTATYRYRPLWGDSLPTFGLGGGDISLPLSITATSIMRTL